MAAEYLSLTFDVLKSATDLTYTVQESTQILNPVDSSPWTLVKSLVLNDGGQPKFIDVDKLNAEITGATLSASDHGYTIRFAIRSNTLTSQGQLFMRLIVQ